VLLEHRVAEDLLQIGGDARFVVVGKAVDADARIVIRCWRPSVSSVVGGDVVRSLILMSFRSVDSAFSKFPCRYSSSARLNIAPAVDTFSSEPPITGRLGAKLASVDEGLL